MAERLSNFTPRPDGRPAIYPWEQWSDGSGWRITRGVDFAIPASNMAAVIRAYAHRTGQRASARVEGDAVEFQFSSPVESEEAAA